MSVTFWSRASKPTRIWLAVFLVWLVMLSGALRRWTGGPGLIQWWKISSLVQKRQNIISSLENRIAELSAEQVRLEKSPVAQRREIRRVLGYLASDEVLFDFSSDPVQPSMARRD